MKYIVVIKDEQNEISIMFEKIYEITNFIQPILEKTTYSVEIMKVMEE
jgi:hypothetical protein